MSDDLPIQRQIDLYTLVWVLSTALPLVYMGHTGREPKDTAAGKVRSF